MIVEDLEHWNVREPGGARSYGVLRLRVRGGAAGWGEGPPLTPAQVEHLRQTVSGQPAYAYKVLHTRLAGHPGAAAVDMALLDCLGRMSKAPVYQVLGGPTRNKVRALTDWSPEALATGHRAFVIGLPEAAFPNPRARFVTRVVERLESLQKDAGDGADFVLDGANRLPPGEAANIAAAVERLHPLFFDEPCALTNLAAARKLAEENVTPLGWGRHALRLAEIQDLLREQMIDVVRLDLARHGITGLRAAAALAETYYVAVAPYHRGGPIATAAALHLAASLPNFFIQQTPGTGRDARQARAELAGADLESAADGYFRLPFGPGLGLDVKERTLRRWTI
jgi:galactonate dehydratase